MSLSHLVNGTALLQALAGSLVAGAGLVTLFAVGLRSLAAWDGVAGLEPGAAATDAASAPGDRLRHARRDPLPLLGAVVCFTVVVGGIGLGLYDLLMT